VINASLFDAKHDAVVWQRRYDDPPRDVQLLDNQIVADVLAHLGLADIEAPIDLERGSTRNREAYRHYATGRHFWNQRTPPALRKAVEEFNQAIELDPRFALAYAGLADSHGLLAAYFIESYPEEFSATEAA